MQRSVRFPSSSGSELAGVLHLPDAGSPRACALFAHCFGCTGNLEAASDIAEALCLEGIAVLRLEFAGPGEGGESSPETPLSGLVRDLVDAADYLKRERLGPDVLVGHSRGGAAVLAAAGRIPSAVAVATLAAPAEVDDLRGLRKALLVMHSPVDEVVPVAEAARLFQAALHPKSFLSLDDADHLLSRPADSRYAGHVLAAWASRFIHDPDEDLEPAIFHTGHVVVSGKPGDIFRVAINADGHRLRGDEPEQYGGTDSGPSPYDLLSAALGSCTVMTLNMYARRKRLALKGVRVDVQHGKIHAKDCADCQTDSGQIDRFRRLIHLDGELTAEQRQRLLEIADRCPVHRTLHSEVRIDSELQD